MTASKHLTIWLGALRFGPADVVLDHANACLCVPLMRVSPDAHRVAPEDHSAPAAYPRRPALLRYWQCPYRGLLAANLCKLTLRL